MQSLTLVENKCVLLNQDHRTHYYKLINFVSFLLMCIK